MRLSPLEVAKISWQVNQQAAIQIAGSGTVTTWSNATAAQQEGQLALVGIVMQNAGMPGGVWGPGLPNAKFHTAGLSVGSTPVVAVAIPATTGALPTAIAFDLGAATLTGTTNCGDTFVVAGITYTILGFNTAASNAVVTYAYNATGGGVGVAIAANTAFSSYTVASAGLVQANVIGFQTIIELLGA